LLENAIHVATRNKIYNKNMQKTDYKEELFIDVIPDYVAYKPFVTNDFIANIQNFISNVSNVAKTLYKDSINKIKSSISSLQNHAKAEDVFTSAQGDRSKIGEDLIKKYDPHTKPTASSNLNEILTGTHFIMKLPNYRQLDDVDIQMFRDMVSDAKALYGDKFNEKKDAKFITYKGEEYLVLAGVETEVFNSFSKIRSMERIEAKKVEQEKLNLETEILQNQVSGYTAKAEVRQPSNSFISV
jgi:gas vesicle protein